MVAYTNQLRSSVDLVKEIADSGFVILVDDFHYMAKAVQAETAKVLKEGVRLGLKICTAAAVHRADDVVRALPELRGRVTAIDLQYWELSDLVAVGTQGFEIMNIHCPHDLIQHFAIEAAGSPQLMQRICLDACLVMGVREAPTKMVYWRPTPEQVKAIYEQASTTTDFRSLVDVLDAGPKLRGAERKEYSFRDGSKGDVYRCILRAMAMDPPILSFDYEESEADLCF
jgi:hypothetical protein